MSRHDQFWFRGLARSRTDSLASSFVVAVTLALTACASPPAKATPDGARPLDPRGRYAITSVYNLGTPPPAAIAILATLNAATDDPDDPARYLIDRMIDAMPPGTPAELARTLAPVLAGYLQAALTDVAPKFASGIRAIALGMTRIAHHFSTIETWEIEPTSATRTISSLAFDVGGPVTQVPLAERGLGDLNTTVSFSTTPTGQLAIADHVMRLDYGTLLRLGMDRAVVPTVDPTASDLASALAHLVDCPHFGQVIANALGLGSPALYETACVAGLAAVAHEVDNQLAAIDAQPLELRLSGIATESDRDGDRIVDQLRDGAWTGTLGSDAVQAATFAGDRAP